MTKSIFRVDHKGFSLLEMTIVLIIMTILVSAAIPVLTRSFLEKAGEKVSLDMFAIEDAARAYYIANGSWPASINVLQTGNYLPSAWNAVNPFGNSYTTSLSGSAFTVSTQVINGSQTAITNRLPLSSITATTVSSSVPVPGSELNSLPSGSIIAWSSTTLPSGFLWCNGQQLNISNYPALFAVLGTTYGGDGVNTFNVPDIRGRTMVGQDGMGQAGATNRITLWGGSPAKMGGTFGEDTHHLTIPELPAHNFYIMINDTTSSGGPVRYPETVNVTSLKPYYTNTIGSDQPHNVVQPSIALGYIIKY